MADPFALSTELRVNVVTPQGPVVKDEDTRAVTAPGELGEFEVLPGHIPFLTALHPGVLTIGEGGDAAIYAVSRGYLRVEQNGSIEVLVERAVAGSKVDVAAARRDLEKAADELDEWREKPQDGDWRNIKDRHDWAQARLDANERA